MPTSETTEQLRALPQVEALLHHQAVTALLEALPRDMVVDMVRACIDDARAAILHEGKPAPETDELAHAVLRQALQLEKPSLRRVVNASGVIIHTNLGRSPLAPSAIEAVTEVSRGYSTLEYDCEAMERGSRHAHYEQLACTVTGAEAAIAVNNNAAAVMMVLAEFAAGHEAVISRGELVEIGGSFRVPDIMALSGARMVEVGTTNKTHLRDYEGALGDDTAVLVKVHPSNYRMSGFTSSVDARELKRLADDENARRRAARANAAEAGALPDVIVYEDLGSGALTEIASDDFRETTVQEALTQGCDLVSFSCDKLLGGPQAGIIAGRAELVNRLKASPYARVLRLDKMAIAALEATLRLYLDDARARAEIPTVRMLTESAADVKARAQALRKSLQRALGKDNVELGVEESVSRAGGGALPMCDIPSHVVRVAFRRGCAQDCERFLAARRNPAVIARINDECILLDARTVLDEGEIGEIVRAFAEYFESLA